MKMIVDIPDNIFKQFIDDWAETPYILQAVRHSIPLVEPNMRLINANEKEEQQMNGNTNMAYIYDTVSHEFDEQVRYNILPEFEDCWVLTSADLRVSKYDTDYKDIMKLLIDRIKRSCIRTKYGYYVVSQNGLRDILENFYKEGINNE